MVKTGPQQALHKKAILFIVFFGVISLFADVTYEGARSIIGPFLGTLGGSAAVVGVVVGFGEFVGYALRLFTGWLADKSQQYWLLTIVGYVINLLAVPLLAFAGSWELAAVLIITERLGKAIRTPARDAILSQATAVTGHGKGFGLHEAMDQIGAITGPLVVSAVFFWDGDYHTAFAWLLVPAILCLLVLAAARLTYPGSDHFKAVRSEQEKDSSKIFTLYLFAVGFIALGFADFPLLAFHFRQPALFTESWIPLTYALAMGVDAIAGIVLGSAFDRFGLKVLFPAILLTAFAAPLAFLGGSGAAIAGVIFWGIGMGMMESVMRAIVATLTHTKKRGWAYGLYNGIFGLSWFLGSATAGFLYDYSIFMMVIFLIAAQLLALPFVWKLNQAYKMHAS